MKLIVGLGNPGEKYAKTRHNAGWIVLDWLAGDDKCWLEKKKLKASICRFLCNIGSVYCHSGERSDSRINEKKDDSGQARMTPIIYAKPLTFMNSSGEAVRKLVDYVSRHPEFISGSKTSKMLKRVQHDEDFDNLLIIHDDLDLPLGEYRLQKGRGAAGHKGVQSVIDCMDSNNFWRLRIGISRPPGNVEPDDYVLQNFSKEELKVLEDLFGSKLASEITNWVSEK